MQEYYGNDSIQAPSLPYPADVGGRADMLDKINPDRIVEELKQKLMGRELDKKTRRWVENPSLKNNAVSELCANDMTTLALSVSNPNVSISKLDDKTIRKRAYGIMEACLKMLISNWRSYKITNSSQIIYVSEIIFSVALITMKQCEGEGIRKMIMGTRHETHNVSEAQMSDKRKRSIFGGRLGR